jgi:cell division protein ZapA
MERRPVQLKVGGQTHRVVSSADEDDLRRLAAVVEGRIHELTPKGKGVAPNAILLAAIALANDLEEERAKRVQLERKTRDLLRRVLNRVDDALDGEAAEE